MRKIIDHWPDAFKKWLSLETDPSAPDDWHNDLDDPGGVTKYGIAQKYMPSIDVKTITRDQAEALLKTEYWLKPGLHLIQHKQLAIKTFTLAGLLGGSRAVKMLQNGCNALGACLNVDGVVGTQTAVWLNAFRHPYAVEEAMETFASTYLMAKGKGKFIAGWLARVDG